MVKVDAIAETLEEEAELIKQEALLMQQEKELLEQEAALASVQPAIEIKKIEGKNGIEKVLTYKNGKMIQKDQYIYLRGKLQRVVKYNKNGEVFEVDQYEKDEKVISRPVASVLTPLQIEAKELEESIVELTK